MGHLISKTETPEKKMWVDYIVHTPKNVKKEENKLLKEKTKPQPASSESSVEYSTSSSDYLP